jgi:pimeloyl-ACP methyl ester carboxylesterase
MSGFSFPFPFFPVQFTKDGVLFQQSDSDALMHGIEAGVTDLFVMSHGWNNNMDTAQNLYSGLSTQLAAQIAAAAPLKGRTFAICGVLWPSKQFDESDLIPGGAASLNDAVTDDQLRARVGNLADLIQARGWPMEAPDNAAQSKLDAVMQSVDDWADDPGVRNDVVTSIRELLPPDSADAEDASDRFFAMKPELLLANLSRTLNPPPNLPEGANASSLDPFAGDSASGLGGAASFRDVLGGVQASLLHLLNFTTFYLMKARAGDVGAKGVAPLIQGVRGARPGLRLHLVGHSFGCRVVTAAVNALPDSGQLRPNTMTLLQGAFSHNGFASKFDDVNDGAFRQVVARKKVRGPILITHTHNDKAVGIAYPIASRIAGQTAAALGDENDIYGGLGSNGAQNQNTTPDRVVGTLLDVGGSYPFAAGATSGRLYNLRADAFIAGHSDIVKPQVAYAVSVALGAPDAA